MRASTVVATLVAVGVTVLAVTMLRDVRSGSESEAAEAETARGPDPVDSVVAVE
jgi:hypothetical protein